ncbi:MAG: carboxymuconolactone decarboxylase family protein [Anaerolineales bacterium]
MARRKFSRRIYHHINEFITDFRFMWQHRPLIRKTMREIIPFPFRERLMMVVTQVNGCRYCSYFHAKESLRAGLGADELRQLLAGAIPDNTPEEELIALIYAQHWAESDAHPEPQITQKLIEAYGAEKAEAIQIILRMIRIGNLLGNTFDYWLYLLSFGHWGLRREEKMVLG